MVLNMTPELLQLLVSKFPNSYDLGELVRKFYLFHDDNKESHDLLEIEHRFIETYIMKRISFQKVG
jgi:hypothetical protein